MAALADRQEIARLEKRIDEDLASIRKEARANFRFLVLALFTVMLATMILGFAAVIAAGG
jgi:hypothetical protein